MSGHKDVLGMYVGENESAKFWLSIMNGLKNRGVRDILIACVDGLTGFPQAIEAVFQKLKSSSALFTRSVTQPSLYPTKISSRSW
jgi:transposase-like protein